MATKAKIERNEGVMQATANVWELNDFAVRLT